MEIDLQAVLQSFQAESEEGLALAEQALLELETRPDDSELIASIFRVIHTIKGNASSLGFDALAGFAHETEDVLDRVRHNQLRMEADVISALLAVVDVLRAAIPAAVADGTDLLPQHGAVRQKLANILSHEDDHALSITAPESANAADSISRTSKHRTLRISVEKLDRLLNLTGEISIARGRVRQMLESFGDATHADLGAVLDAHNDTDRLFSELQETVMKARMVALGPVFRQCGRAVRDIAAKLGKQAELFIEGESVEVDTSVTELIRDPLMHMVRNALDHGIETPDERRSQGKHPKGRLDLKARYQGGVVVIELSDDGSGIDTEAVLAQARIQNLVGENERPSDQELYRLLFRGGFSTASNVTDVSGRGVGMEVVRNNIEALRGTLRVSSAKGVGTTISIHLPLTLAIMDGFMVEIGDEGYVVPLENAVECLDFPAQFVGGADGTAVIDFRGHPLPVVRLRTLFESPGHAAAREKVLVVRNHDSLAGLVVDEFLGQRQVVIKALGRFLQNPTGVSGSTILGDGRVALILDVPALIEEAQNSRH